MRLTREGKRFLLATGLIVVAALNTGNNLIYLILSMMLSLLALAVLLLWLNMKGLSLQVFQTQAVFARKPAMIHLSVSNSKRRIPSYSVRAFMPGKEKNAALFPEVPPLSSLSDTISFTYEKRGMYAEGDFIIESGFPFIFLLKKSSCRVKGSVLVYPELRECDEVIAGISTSGSELSVVNAGHGDDFSMIREFRYGDDRRKIHWKATAKVSQLMVTEYASAEPRKLTLILDNLMPDDMESFEKAVSLTASIADRFLSEGYFVRLFTCKKIIPFGSGKEHLFKILDVLAVIEGQGSMECPLSHEEELQGLVVLILNSAQSPLNTFASLSDMVIHAGAL